MDSDAALTVAGVGAESEAGIARTAWRAAWWLGLVALVVLVVTGVWLGFAYEPTPSEAWEDTGLSQSSPSAPWSRVHLVAGWTVLGAAVVGTVVGLVTRVRRGAASVLMAIGASLAAVGIWVGGLVGFDQLALNAVRIGGDLRGVPVAEILADDVRFLLIGGREVGPWTYLGGFAVHVVVAVFLIASWVLARAVGSARPNRETAV